MGRDVEKGKSTYSWEEEEDSRQEDGEYISSPNSCYQVITVLTYLYSRWDAAQAHLAHSGL